MISTLRTGMLAVCALVLAGSLQTATAQAPVATGNGNDPVLDWNDVLLQAIVDDHSGTFGLPDQEGPTRTSRAMAIVHLAIYDAVNAIVGGYQPYIPVNLDDELIQAASLHAAVAQAAHDTLVALYPQQAEVFAAHLQNALRNGKAKKGRDEGIQVGERAADNILDEREDLMDSMFAADGFFDFDAPKVIGEHRPEPDSPFLDLLLTPDWGSVCPFGIEFVTDFTAPPPPALDSPEYTAAYNRVKVLGEKNSTVRTAEQTEIGLFWSYDGSIGLGVPPRLYNQVVRVICKSERNTVAENARLFALVNMAQADAGIVAWHNKYLHNFWRPIWGIRCGGDDGNEDTEGDENWIPLGASATNQSQGGVDFTPPFPAYTSGHATFGAATFRMLANFYDTDEYHFRLTSDEMQGRTTDAQGKHRYTVVRTFESFTEAAWENAESRIYLGIHWDFDAEWGVFTGNAVADDVFGLWLKPVQ